jgi:hypothetical protein
MRAIITVGSNRTIQNSHSPHKEPQRNAKSAYLCAFLVEHAPVRDFDVYGIDKRRPLADEFVPRRYT